jgi:hypothetical protein
MAPRIVTEGPDDSLMDTGPPIGRPTYLHWSPIRRNRCSGNLFCPHLLRIGDRFGGRLAVIDLARYLLTAGPARGSVATVDGACRVWARGLPGGEPARGLEHSAARRSRISGWNSWPFSLGSRNPNGSAANAFGLENRGRTSRFDGPNRSDCRISAGV